MYALAALDFRWICCRLARWDEPGAQEIRPLDGWHHAIETLLGAAAFGFCSIKRRCEETTRRVGQRQKAVRQATLSIMDLET